MQISPSDETSAKEGFSPPPAKKPPTPAATPNIPSKAPTKTDELLKPPTPDISSLLLPATKARYEGGKGTTALGEACHHVFQAMQSVLFLREQGGEGEKATVALVKERDSLREKVEALCQEMRQTKAALDKERTSSNALSKRVHELGQQKLELGKKNTELEERYSVLGKEAAGLKERNVALMKEKIALKEKLLDSTAYYALKGRLELLEGQETIPEKDLLVAQTKKDLEVLFPDGDPLEGFDGETSDNGGEEQTATSSDLPKKKKKENTVAEEPSSLD